MTVLVVGILAALAPTLAVLATYLLARRDRNAKSETQTTQLANIHVLVNGRLQIALDRIAFLEQQLGFAPDDHK